MPILPLVHPAIQDSPPSVPGFVQITDGDNHRLQYRDRLGDSKAHCLPRGFKGYPWRPQSFQRPCSQSQYRIVGRPNRGCRRVGTRSRKFCQRESLCLSRRKPRSLDTDIMNAGLASVQWNMTPDGWGRQVQVHVLSTTLLGLLLLPQLARTRCSADQAPPHLVLVGSDTHLDAKFYELNSENILAELNKKETCEKSIAAAGQAERYNVSKLLELYVAIELASLATSVIVDVVAPGFLQIGTVDERTRYAMGVDRTSNCDSQDTAGGKQGGGGCGCAGPRNSWEIFEPSKHH
jgi:NAD(P)-dependent dehydrogenase (short-subunit alcohol dehydrogenase family)